jgi:hypothetical protein
MSPPTWTRHFGEEMWSAPASLRTCKGSGSARPGAARGEVRGLVDGDLLRELLDRNRISKWD